MWRRCSGWSAATCCSTRCRRWPTRTRRRRSRSPRARSRWATTCARSAASCPAMVRDLLVLVGRSVAHQRSGDRRRRGARSPEGARGALLARGSAARVRPADARRSRTSRARRSRAITSRWRCCGGSTCASCVPIEDLIAGRIAGPSGPASAALPTHRARGAQHSSASCRTAAPRSG